MNTWSFPPGAQNKNQTDPLTFTHQEINNKILEENNQQINSNNNNNNKNEDEVKQDTKINYYKDLNYEGQKTNEMRNFTIKDTKHGDSQINENNNNPNNLNEEREEENNDNVYIRYEYGDEGQGNYSQNYDDLYYISEIIPPQNFSEKLRNIKIKYQKLKEDIEKLKKENKKYNPYFITRKNNNIP